MGSQALLAGLLITADILIFSIKADQHKYDQDGHTHSTSEDHKLFLGEKMKKEFDSLSLEESRRRLRLLVPHIDLDKDGFITFPELETWITHKLKRWNIKEDVEALYRDCDRNRDGKVAWDEFSLTHYGFLESDTHGLAEAGKENFKDLIKRDKRRWLVADNNNDTMLNETEFEFFRHPWEHEVMMRIVAMEELEEADTNKDGFLSMNEYIASIHLPEMRHFYEKEFHEKHDINRDGKLDLDEVEEWKRPEDFNKASLEARHLIAMADENQDGKLDTDEIIMHHMIFVSSSTTQHGLLLHEEF
ncbi:calumenin-like [Rhopilema esculentum]|uniref:calumenin-like n=1 Tax=Rhopilema esculentum TaxID=499914 RepID=UPI0031D12991